jgi:hypothetical protein
LNLFSDHHIDRQPPQVRAARQPHWRRCTLDETSSAKAAALGCMPLPALTVIFHSSPELSMAFGDLIDSFSALFAIDWWSAANSR